MRTTVLFLAFVAAIGGVPAEPTERHAQGLGRIVGGATAQISQYPFAAVLQFSPNLQTFIHTCGGSILNNRSVLSAASCFHNTLVSQWRIRVGSFLASSGGVLHNPDFFINHPNYIPM